MPSDPQRLRAIHRRIRESHRVLFDLQGQSITGLREAIDAISRTHDEMATLFQADNDLEDTLDEEGDSGQQR